MDRSFGLGFMVEKFMESLGVLTSFPAVFQLALNPSACFGFPTSPLYVGVIGTFLSVSNKTHPFPPNLATKSWKKPDGNPTLKLRPEDRQRQLRG